MTSPAVKAWLTVLLLAVGAYGSFTLWKVYQAHATTADAAPPAAGLDALSPVPLEDFTFTDSDGRPFAMEQLRGKVWIASYFFATCPGFCLQMNQEIAALARELADQDVTFVSFTVDPENDTPEKLKEYRERMGADADRWVFLTGELDEIRALGQKWLKMPVSKDHNDKLVVVGRDGRIKGFFASRDAVQVKLLKKKLPEWVGE
ncbi:MAG TPA: SCO family protein [Pirellulales bacterium]|nr:SCO family protein [Pirellulales bacterium]